MNKWSPLTSACAESLESSTLCSSHAISLWWVLGIQHSMQQSGDAIYKNPLGLERQPSEWSTCHISMRTWFEILCAHLEAGNNSMHLYSWCSRGRGKEHPGVSLASQSSWVCELWVQWEISSRKIWAGGDSSVDKSSCWASRRTWAQIPTIRVKSWTWLCTPVTPSWRDGSKGLEIREALGLSDCQPCPAPKGRTPVSGKNLSQGNKAESKEGTWCASLSSHTSIWHTHRHGHKHEHAPTHINIHNTGKVQSAWGRHSMASVCKHLTLHMYTSHTNKKMKLRVIE